MKRFLSGLTALVLTVTLSPLGVVPFALAMDVEAGDTQSVILGDSVTIEAEASTLDGDATSVVGTIDWGDGTTEEVTGVIGADHVSIDSTHTYASADTYTVTVTATEYDSSMVALSTVSDTTTVEVAEFTAMTIDAGDDQSVEDGTEVTVTAVASDVDGNLEWAEFTWGDGESDFYNAIPEGETSWEGSHTYDNVTETTSYEVTVCMSDGTTTDACDTVTIEVTVTDVEEEVCTYTADAYESNDSIEEAYVLVDGDSIEASMCVAAGEDHYDYYSIELGDGETLTYTVEYQEVIYIPVIVLLDDTGADVDGEEITVTYQDQDGDEVTDLTDYYAENGSYQGLIATTEYTSEGDATYYLKFMDYMVHYVTSNIDGTGDDVIADDSALLDSELEYYYACETFEYSLSVDIAEPVLPDLTVSGLTYNDSGTISFTCANEGDGDVAEGTEGVTQVYYDGEVASSYMWSDYGGYAETSFFEAGDSGSAFITGTVPSDVSEVEICIDGEDEVEESDEENNCSSLSLLPDLEVTDIYVDEYNVEYTAVNNGVTDVDVETDGARNYAYTDTGESTSYTWSNLERGGNTEWLQAGTSQEDLGAFGYYLSDGIYEVTVCVDYDDDVTESDEDNNCLTETVIVGDVDLPDLIISEMSLGTDGAFSYVIENQGDEYVYDYEDVDVSIDITYPDGTESELTSVPYFTDETFSQPGGYSTIDAATFSDAGTYSVTVCADSSEAVTEESEDNNCMTEEFEFAGYSSGSGSTEPSTDYPDLIISTIDVDDADTLYYVIENQGAGYVTDYESVEDAVAITDPSGSTSEFTSTPGASDITFSQAGGYSTITLNSLADEGTYTVTICTDTTEVVTEESEDNNCTSVDVEIGGDGDGSDDGSDGGTDDDDDDDTPAPVYGGGAATGGSSSSSSSSSSDDDSGDDDITLASDDDIEDICGEWEFTDVSEDASYYAAIYEAWCQGIVHGRTSDAFMPEDEITRGEAAKVVAGVFGYSPVEDLTETSYIDLEVDNPLAPYIEALTADGMLEGYIDEGTFKSEQDIIESEVEALMERVTGGEDVDVSEYVEENGTIKRGNFMEFILQYMEY